MAWVIRPHRVHRRLTSPYLGTSGDVGVLSESIIWSICWSCRHDWLLA